MSLRKAICPECKQEFIWVYGVTHTEIEDSPRFCSWICIQVFEHEQKLREVKA